MALPAWRRSGCCWPPALPGARRRGPGGSPPASAGLPDVDHLELAHGVLDRLRARPGGRAAAAPARPRSPGGPGRGPSPPPPVSRRRSGSPASPPSARPRPRPSAASAPRASPPRWAAAARLLGAHVLTSSRAYVSRLSSTSEANTSRIERPSASAAPLALGAVLAGQRRVDPERARAGAVQASSRSATRRRRELLAALEVDHAPVQPVANRAPEVLLHQPRGGSVEGHALVVVQRRLGHRRRDQPGQGGGLPRRGLGVADPHLHGAEGGVRPHAPPQLRVLDEGARSSAAGRRSRRRPASCRTRRGCRSAGSSW